MWHNSSEVFLLGGCSKTAKEQVTLPRYQLVLSQEQHLYQGIWGASFTTKPKCSAKTPNAKRWDLWRSVHKLLLPMCLFWVLLLTGDVAAISLGHLPVEGTFNWLVLSSQSLST